MKSSVMNFRIYGQPRESHGYLSILWCPLIWLFHRAHLYTLTIVIPRPDAEFFTVSIIHRYPGKWHCPDQMNQTNENEYLRSVYQLHITKDVKDCVLFTWSGAFTDVTVGFHGMNNHTDVTFFAHCIFSWQASSMKQTGTMCWALSM